MRGYVSWYNLGSWWRKIGMCARWLAAGPDGSVRELLAYDTSSGVQGSSHGWYFSSLCFSLLSLHYGRLALTCNSQDTGEGNNMSSCKVLT